VFFWCKIVENIVLIIHIVFPIWYSRDFCLQRDLEANLYPVGSPDFTGETTTILQTESALAKKYLAILGFPYSHDPDEVDFFKLT
jgi:hypothetical protein